MNPNLSDIIQDFILFFESNSSENVIIKGNYSTNSENFLTTLTENEFFSQKKILPLHAENKKFLKKILQANAGKNFDIIFAMDNIFPLYEIQNQLENHEISGRIIYISDEKNNWNDENIFVIPEISFRQYAKNENSEIVVADIFKKTANTENYEKIFQNYLQSGSFIKNLENNSEIIADFERKCELISAEIFEKEREIFVDFIRTLALEVGNLFKEDKIAKNLGISRRKIAKFVEVLKKHNIITEIFPFVENYETELSRHKKIYFSDLSFFRGALGVMYGIGAQKIATIENFIFLELSRKLEDSHELFFWKKKSGAGIHFVLRNNKNENLTPIEISTKKVKNISVIMKNFYESYAEKIENSMILNESEVLNSNFEGKPFFILPYYAI